MKPTILFVAIAVGVFLVAHYLAEPIDGGCYNMEKASYYHYEDMKPTVKAVQMDRRFFVRSCGKGEKGDYLLEWPTGHRGVVPKGQFEEEYHLVTDNP